MNFVTGDGKHINVLLLNVYGHMTEGLNRVGVEPYFAFAAQGADFLYGLDCAYFVVGVHNGHKAGVGANGGFNILNADYAVFVNGNIGYLKPLLFKGGAGVKHGMVLKGGGDYVLFAALCHGGGGAFNRPVVGFGTAGGEINLVRLCAKDGSYLLSGALKRPARFAAL